MSLRVASNTPPVIIDYIDALVRLQLTMVENAVASHSCIPSHVSSGQPGDPRCWNRLSAGKIAAEDYGWRFWASEPSWVYRLHVQYIAVEGSQS